MRKFNFNMVEIALAMVVIAIGISGILGLFSVGVNAKKAAINENNIADAAEYILGLYRAVIVDTYNTVYEEADGDTTKKIKLIDSIPASNSLAGSGSAPDLAAAGSSVDISSLTGEISSHIYTGIGSTVSNFNIAGAKKLPETFVYAPSRVVDSVRIADCEIVGSIWKSKIPVTFPDNTGVSSVDMDYGYGVRVYLELSWPLAAAYEKRDKKVFVMDIVNPKPVLAVKTAAQGGQ